MSDNEVDSVVEVPTEADSTTTTPASDVEGDEVTPLGTLTPEQKRLADTQAALKERQAEFHKLSNELAELKGQINGIKQTSQSAPVPVKDWLDDEELQKQMRDDPVKAIEVVKRLREEMTNQIVGVLSARDEFFKKEIAKANPELIAMRAKIDELRKDPDYQEFTDAQLIVIAKKSNPKATYRGTPGGARVPAENEDIRKSTLFKRIYGSESSEI